MMKKKILPVQIIINSIVLIDVTIESSLPISCSCIFTNEPLEIFSISFNLIYLGFLTQNTLCANTDPFLKQYMSSKPKSCKYKYNFYVKNDDLTRPQFYTCHNSWAVVACAKLWSGWIVRIEIRANRISVIFQLWAHQPCAKWSLGWCSPQLVNIWPHHGAL